MLDKDYAIILRGELMKQAEGLKLQREAVLSQISLLERKYNLEPVKGKSYHDRREQTIQTIATHSQSASGANS